MPNTVVRVQHLIKDVDMRPTKSMATGKFRVFGTLGRGQIALMLNKRCTIARFIDCERTIHTMYAKEDEQFDLATIEAMVASRTLAIGVKVVRNPKLKAKRVTGLSVEPVKKTRKNRAKKAA